MQGEVPVGEVAASPGSSGIVLVVGWSLTALLVIAVVLLGSEDFDGSFGVTGQPLSCGSVLRIPGDLNGATCRGALESRVALTSVTLGAAVLFAVGTPIVARARGHGSWSRRLRVLLGATVLLSGVVALTSYVVWNHMIWSVSGA